MATALRDSTEAILPVMSTGIPYRIGIVRAEWNQAITGALETAALDILHRSGMADEQIKLITVPGSFELTAGAQLLLETGLYDAIICLGCVIQGETRHFDFICQAVATGLTLVATQYKKPVIFGVLTTRTLEQAQARAGGALGNKGEEAAVTALKMAELYRNLKQPPKPTAGFR